MPKKQNYTKYSKEELIAEITELKKQKKYGLVWNEEREPEKVVMQCKNELPVLKEVKSKAIQNDPDKPTHILIEGDNYHALSVLNYTHQNAIDVIYIDPPYNTGAKDWKYNNHFVDSEDSYRHSKWLSMMNNRLKITKSLLSSNGVLICTIDKYEQARLHLLLTEIFIGYEIVCVTIIHNPAGTQGKNFSYTNEYAFFVFPKNGLFINKTRRENALVSAFRDWGTISLRSQAKTCFYPIIVKDMEIIGFGNVCENNFHPKTSNIKQKDGSIHIYPIDQDGVEKKWVFSRTSVEKIQKELFCKKSRGDISVFRKKYEASYKTVWDDKSFYANIYGSKLLNHILDNDFPFPKSLFAVMESISAVIHNKKDAVILDYFAGSGTTGHAVLELNKKDGGNRQFIMATNNENNIATGVCFPRIKKVITGYKNKKGKEIDGLGGNLKYFKTTFVPAKSTDRNKEKLTKQSVEMLCLKENTFDSVLESDKIKIFKNNDHYTGILFDEKEIPHFKKKINDFDLPVSVYVFSLGDDDFAEEFSHIKDKVKVCSIPAAILQVYKRIFR